MQPSPPQPPNPPSVPILPIGLLACDMDGTVVPPALDAARRHAIEQLRRLVAEADDLRFAYVTGRHLELALSGIRANGLPLPDALCCDVGTSVYFRRGSDWQLDGDYRRQMAERIGGVDAAAAIDAAAREVAALTAQEPEKQTAFKRSFYLPALSDAEVDGWLARLRERLEARDLRAQLVYSVDAERGVGLLDVLPRGVAKHTALDFLRQRYSVPLESLLFAGDSGNDLAALVSGCAAILVANAPERVRRQVIELSAEHPQSERVYLAEAPDILGVVEGCRHFGLL